MLKFPTVYIHCFSGLKRIFYCNVSRRESWRSCIVEKEIKICVLLKSSQDFKEKLPIHLVFDITTGNGTFW